MKSNRFLALIGVVCALCVPLRAFASEELKMELLPKGRPFRLTFIDPREIRMALAYEADAKIDAMIGNYFSLFAVEPKGGSLPDWIFHFGIEGAGYFTMRQADSRFPLETTDGLLGTYAEMASGPWQYQLRFTHISAHLADGSSSTPIAYSREFLSLRAAYAPSFNFEVYSGAHYLTHSVPEVSLLALQLGSVCFFPLGDKNLVPFTGLDLRWSHESIVTLSVAAQIGVALNNPPEAYRSFRIFYAYYSGEDPRGQFYTRVYTSNSIGIEMQI